MGYVNNYDKNRYLEKFPKAAVHSVLGEEPGHWLSKCPSFSSRLKQASMLYMMGYYQTSLDVLSSLTGLVRYTVCECYLDKDILVRPDEANLLETTRGISDVTPEYLVRNVIIPCVYFLPTERSVTPTALCYEMKRMKGPRPESEDDICDHDEDRGDWAFVDGNFLLQFLAVSES